jgi:tRNA threonylcarbamoyl adenosine modification protein YeaZ
MLVLAFDTSLDACSAAAVDATHDSCLAEIWEPMERGHAEALAPMVQKVMEEAGLAFTRLDRMAVTVGPGTFTGVRIGIAMARGLGLALNKPVVGVTTLEAISLNVEQNSEARPVASVIDARRGDFYLAVYSALGATLVAPRAVQHAHALAFVPEGSLIAGPGADPLLDLARAAGRDLTAAAVEALPRASRIARHAARLPTPSEPPRPLYLRAPDAKPQDGTLAIGTATAGESGEIAAMHAQCFADGWPAADIARLMAMPGAISLVAVEPASGRPAGFLIARRAADEAEIITIGALPEARRRRVATQLIGNLIGRLASAGVRSLFIEVAAGNAAARGLYDALGFNTAGRRASYYEGASGSSEDAIVMRLAL